MGANSDPLPGRAAVPGLPAADPDADDHGRLHGRGRRLLLQRVDAGHRQASLLVQLAAVRGRLRPVRRASSRACSSARRSPWSAAIAASTARRAPKASGEAATAAFVYSFVLILVVGPVPGHRDRRAMRFYLAGRIEADSSEGIATLLTLTRRSTRQRTADALRCSSCAGWRCAFGRHDGAARHQPGGPARPDAGDHRRERLRQDRAAEDDHRPDPTDARRGLRSTAANLGRLDREANWRDSGCGSVSCFRTRRSVRQHDHRPERRLPAAATWQAHRGQEMRRDRAALAWPKSACPTSVRAARSRPNFPAACGNASAWPGPW